MKLKLLYISSSMLKILEDKKEYKLYEYVTKNNIKFLIKTKLPLFNIERLKYLIHPDLENNSLIELNDEDNKLKVKAWRKDNSSYTNKCNDFNNTCTSSNFSNKNLDKIELLLNKKIEELKEWIEEKLSKPRTYNKRKTNFRHSLSTIGYISIRVNLNIYKIITQPEIYKEGEDNFWKIITKHKGVIRTINITTKAPISEAKYINFYLLPDLIQQTEWNIKDDSNQITYGL